MNNINIYKLPDENVSLLNIYDAVTLLDDTFGSGYYKNASQECSTYWIGLAGNKTVAFSSVKEPANSLDEAILKFNVVDGLHRGRGIGQQMALVRMKYLIAKGYKRIKSYAWTYDGICPAAKSLTNLGFKAIGEQTFSKDYNINNPCSLCGPNCTCCCIVFECDLSQQINTSAFQYHQLTSQY